MNRGQYQRFDNIVIDRSRGLGSGTYGGVFRGYVITNGQKGPSLMPVAIKQSVYETHNIQEVTTLQILKHPNIIQYIDYRVHGNRLFMVMELCQQGTLQDLLYRVQKDFQNSATIANPKLRMNLQPTYGQAMKYGQKVIEYYSQIVEGIRFMYSKNILHRDLKPSNILIKGNVIKIADFGTSKISAPDNQLKTLVGTPLFCSPELLAMSLSQNDKYTEKSDIWSLGLILYFMFNYQRHSASASDRLKQSLPWSGKNNAEVLRAIKNQPLKFKNEFIPQNIKQIIAKMLTINVQDRMSFEQFLSLEEFKIKKQSKMQVINQVRQCVVELVDKKVIDEQLMSLIQMEVNQNEEIDEIVQFYRLIIQELQGQDQFPYQLQIHLYANLYRALGDENDDERTMIKDKFFQRKSLFEELDKPNENQEGLAIKINRSDINFIQQQLTPTSAVVYEAKAYIRKQLVLINKFSKVLQSSHSKIPSADEPMMTLNSIYGVYDLCTLLALQSAWQGKRKLNCKISEYQKNRNSVEIEVLIDRIKKAATVFKISQS